MTIHLKPELERLLQQHIERGPCQSADEFVERGIQMLHNQEERLSAKHAGIGAKIEEGYSSAQRGELIDDQIRLRMEEKKRAWRSQGMTPVSFTPEAKLTYSTCGSTSRATVPLRFIPRRPPS